MINLTEHKYLNCYKLSLSVEAMARLDSYQLAADAINRDYKLERKLRLQAEARLAKAYFDAFEEALDDAEVITEADED